MNAFKEALKLLAMRSYFSAELRKKLLLKGLDPHEIEKALEKCIELGYLNDREREEHYIAQLRKKGYGPHWIHHKMREKGMPSSHWQQSIEQQVQVIQALIHKKCKGKRPTDPKALQRLYAFLARKGFDSEAILSILK